MAHNKKKAEEGLLPEELLNAVPLNIDLNEKDAVLPDPDLMRYWDNVKNRTLYLESDIDGEMITSFSKMIIAWNREDEKSKFQSKKENQ